MARLGRDEWIAAAVEELAAGGIDAVRVEVLARKLGVTKGSFYWHFAGRDDLFEALLRWYEVAETDDIITTVEATASGPEERFRALAELVFAPSETADRAEPAFRAWGSSDPRAAAVLDRVDRRRLTYVTDLLVGTGLARPVAKRRAELVYRALIGEFVWRAHGGPALTRATRAELIDLVLG